MCGIAGLLAPLGAAAVDRRRLARMCDALAHRGPDGDGTWFSADGRLGLGHRRLAIVDLSAAANQPMTDVAQTVAVVSNGEIYNHAALRRELIGMGHAFATDHADTEVLVQGFLAWGIDGLIERLQGMFAFALWDGRARRLHLVRDRLGIKPLCFAWVGGTLVFASEIKAIVAHGGFTPAVCQPALWHALSFLTAPSPLTLFEGVFKLPAGTRIAVEADGSWRAFEWWRAGPGRSSLAGRHAGAGLDDLANAVRAGVEQAVSSHMMADVPVGAFLSGGIDSSAIVGLMAQASDAPVHTFTAGFSDHRHLNEFDWAERVARHFGTRHHAIEIDADAMMGSLDDLVHAQDEPVADWVSVPLQFLARAARAEGIKVVQVGEGADELFAGYPNWRRWLAIERWFWSPWRAAMPAPLRRMVAALAGRAARPWPGLGRGADLLDRAARPDGLLFWSGAVALWDGPKRALFAAGGGASAAGSVAAERLVGGGLLPAVWLGRDSEAVPAVHAQAFARAHPDAGPLQRMTALDLRQRLPELLLMRVDRLTMAQSIEARVPFLDHRLVDLAFDLPAEAQLEGGLKPLLKRAMRGLLPDDVIQRPKQGFGAPMAAWLKGAFGRRAEAEILSSPLLGEAGIDGPAVAAMIAAHRTGARDCALPIWVLYSLTAWHRRWIER